jgi:RHS repeat-associated protein
MSTDYCFHEKRTCAWDYKNELTQVATGTATSTFGYDYAGSRVQMRSSGYGTTTYPNQFFNKQNGTTTKHIFAGGELVATIVGNGVSTSSYIVHTDHLGGTHVVTNASGTVVQTNDYYPYGDARINTGSYTDQRGFIGTESDPSTNLSYMAARYYTGARGTFLSEDPTHLAMGDPERLKSVTGYKQAYFLADPQSVNSYSYARNNPLRYKDPNGNCPICIAAGLGAVGGVGVQAFNDYYSGEFGQRSWGENLGTYGFAAASGATVAAGATAAGILAVGVGGFSAGMTAFTAGGTAASLSGITTSVGDRLLGRYTGPGELAVGMAMAGLTAGVLELAPKVPGAKPQLLMTILSGARAQRQGIGEFVSSGMQLYGQTMARSASQAGYSPRGGGGGSNGALIQQLQSLVSTLQGLVASLSAASSKK